MSIIRDFKVGMLNILILDNRNNMGIRAGGDAAAYFRKLLAEREEINVMFAAAPSQNETLEALRTASGIEWHRINAFHMDEYIGLSDSHPAGFRNFLRRELFNRLPFKNVYLMGGNASEPWEIAKEYERILRARPLDACLMGVGENGHIAFNDPSVANFNDTKLVKIVELDLSCRKQQVHDGCFEELNEVPTHALTVTIPALTSAKRIFCSVPAETKATAVKEMLEGEITTDCPASILRTHSSALLYLDPDSSKHIK